ncbi:MAG: hypothetical protein DMG35_10815 [Acidobacteria bacterium]|nr:MAG: hypothetical protein DMG35_10815 [Acidobacteriota bacterium]
MKVETWSTSRVTEKAKEIVLRQGPHARLVFAPTIVENLRNPAACIKGEFFYEKKALKDAWIPDRQMSLASLKTGEGYALALKSEEVLTLLQQLRPLYTLYEQHGIQSGQNTWLLVPDAPEEDLLSLLNSQSEEALKSMRILLRWVASSPNRHEVLGKLAILDPTQLPALNALLGLAALKDAQNYWLEHHSNEDESFWRRSLKERAYILSQLFAYPILIIGEEAYLGGKQLDNTGGHLVDLLAKTEGTSQVVLIEIKTPGTRILGSRYRNKVYPLSTGISGAIAQILKYRQRLMQNWRGLLQENSADLTLGDPRCLLIAGNTEEEFKGDAGPAMRDDFELLRERTQGVTIVTYDELFRKLDRLVKLFEG